jgi:hypothetical protein
VAPTDEEQQLAQIWRESRVDAPQPRRFRSRPGRRVSGRAVLGGLGLLGLLLTVGILGLLGARVLSSVDERSAPDLTVPGADPSGSDPATAADPARCAADRRSVEAAVQAYTIQNGAPPTDLGEVVAAGLLAEPVTSFEYRPGASPELIGVEACAGS